MGRGRKTIVAGVSELGAHDLSLRVALELGPGGGDGGGVRVARKGAP